MVQATLRSRVAAKATLTAPGVPLAIGITTPSPWGLSPTATHAVSLAQATPSSDEVPDATWAAKFEVLVVSADADEVRVAEAIDLDPAAEENASTTEAHV